MNLHAKYGTIYIIAEITLFGRYGKSRNEPSDAASSSAILNLPRVLNNIGTRTVFVLHLDGCFQVFTA